VERRAGGNVFMEKIGSATDPPRGAARDQGRRGSGRKTRTEDRGRVWMCRPFTQSAGVDQAHPTTAELGENFCAFARYRMEGQRTARAQKPAADEATSKWQLPQFHQIPLGLPADFFAEMDIHQIDELCWIKDANPNHRAWRRWTASPGQHGLQARISIRSRPEWTFATGRRKRMTPCATSPKCQNEFATYIHGTKRARAIFRQTFHAGPPCAPYKDQRISPRRKHRVGKRRRKRTHRLADCSGTIFLEGDSATYRPFQSGGSGRR